jgi:nitrate/TMAO reductase-like tetraheme cytochrome c subunit
LTLLSSPLSAIESSPLSIVELACAALSATILVAYLVFRPPLGRTIKIWLLLGLGVFPIGAAFAGNVQGFEATKERVFCGSCHVMALHQADSDDRTSGSLAARHARNAMFGSENCYACHADYGMFGTIVTKAGGMRHVWLFLTAYRTTPLEEAKKTIHLREPAAMNGNCIHCHSTEDTLWLKVPDHAASLDDTRAGRLGCASQGCHGLAHPFFQPPAAEVKP